MAYLSSSTGCLNAYAHWLVQAPLNTGLATAACAAVIACGCAIAGDFSTPTDCISTAELMQEMPSGPACGAPPVSTVQMSK